MKECTWDSRPIYEKLIDPIRIKAKELGYAVAVHGTLKRDIDLVAIPWIAEAVEPKVLAMALHEVVLAVHGKSYLQDDPFHMDGCPGHKPHGRLVWSFYFAVENGNPAAFHGYVDLSVMPRMTNSSEKTST
jgi:hypothetical protein